MSGFCSSNDFNHKNLDVPNKIGVNVTLLETSVIVDFNLTWIAISNTNPEYQTTRPFPFQKVHFRKSLRMSKAFIVSLDL